MCCRAGGAARCVQARLERLGEDEALGFTFRMLEATGPSGRAAAGRGSGSVGEEGLDCTALQAAVAACVRMAAEAAGLAEAQGQVAEAQAAAVAEGALAVAEGGGGDGGRRLSRDAYRKWVKRVPALHAALSAVLLRVGAGGGGGVPRCPACLGPPLPQLVQLGKLAPHATLLQPTWSWVVSSRLPPGEVRAVSYVASYRAVLRLASSFEGL